MAMSIDELIAKQPSGPYVENNPEGYSIWDLPHNDGLVYRESKRYLVVQVSSRRIKNAFLGILIYFLRLEGYRLLIDSISKWNDDTPVTLKERNLIVERIINYFSKYQKRKIRLAK